MSNVPLFVWPVGPIINTEPIRYVVNKTDHDLVVDALREQNRVLCLEFQSLLNVIDDSYDEDLPVEIVEARNKAQAALTATSQPTAAEVHQRMFDHGDATSQEGQHESR